MRSPRQYKPSDIGNRCDVRRALTRIADIEVHYKRKRYALIQRQCAGNVITEYDDMKGNCFSEEGNLFHRANSINSGKINGQSIDGFQRLIYITNSNTGQHGDGVHGSLTSGSMTSRSIGAMPGQRSASNEILNCRSIDDCAASYQDILPHRNDIASAHKDTMTLSRSSSKGDSRMGIRDNIPSRAVHTAFSRVLESPNKMEGGKKLTYYRSDYAPKISLPVSIIGISTQK